MEILLTAVLTAFVLFVLFGAIAWSRGLLSNRAAGQADIQASLKSQFAEASQEALAGASEQLLKLAEERFGRQMELSSKDLESKKHLIDQQVKTVSEELHRVQKVVTEFEKDRESKFGEITTQLKQMGEQTLALSTATSGLRDVLSGPQTRGQWGERMAEDILRLIGFVEGVNYEKQSVIEGAGSRPDFVFPLPGDLSLNMDVKFPFDNYVRYTEAEDATERERHKVAFVKDVNARVKELTTRDYIDPGQGTVDYVLMFVPNENLYSFVHENDPAFLDNALRQKVICCSPTTLFAVLVVIRQAVDNFALRKSEEEIVGLMGQFNQQWGNFLDSLDKLGRQMQTAQKTYESVVGTRKNQLQRPLRRIEALRSERGLPIAQSPEQGEVLEIGEDPVATVDSEG